MLYLCWDSDGVIVRLVESKAKLTPFDQKGDVVKAELCGTVFAVRLKKYFEKHCRIKVTHWIHLVDSQQSWELYRRIVTASRPSSTRERLERSRWLDQ